MSERNRCIESGCKGYCCQDIDLEITRAEVKELFPTAVRVFSIKELAKLKQTRKGLFYTNYQRPGLEGPDFMILSINGPCPNRVSNGGCLIHTNREHAAKSFLFGSDDCNAIRKEHGLGPVFLEPVE
jgi:hypothetical protein